MPEEATKTEVDELDAIYDEALNEDGTPKEDDTKPEKEPAKDAEPEKESEKEQLQKEIAELRIRLEEAEEILANPSDYVRDAITKEKPIPEKKEETDYDDLAEDPKRFAKALEEQIVRTVKSLMEERERPRIEKEQVQEMEQLQEVAKEQVAKCEKYKDWDKYKSEVQKQAIAFEKKYGLKALLDARFIEKTYRDLRFEAAEKRLKKPPIKTTTEKPSVSSSGADKPQTLETLFDEAWDGLDDAEIAQLEGRQA